MCIIILAELLADDDECNRDGDMDIYAIRPDGSEIVQLTDELGYDGQPAWSPDGQSLAFVSDRDGNLEIYILEFSGD